MSKAFLSRIAVIMKLVLFPRLIWNTLGYLLNAIDMVRLKTRLNIVSKMSVNPMYLLSKLAIEMDSIASMWLQPFAHHFP